MDNKTFNVRSILAGEAPNDAAIAVRGWVRTRRDSKAGISFIHLSDGSSFHPVQVVAPNTLSNYTDEVLKLTSGCAVEWLFPPRQRVNRSKCRRVRSTLSAGLTIRIPIRSNQSHTPWNFYVRWPISGPEPT